MKPRAQRRTFYLFLLSALAALCFAAALFVPSLKTEAEAVILSQLPAAAEDLFTDYTRTELSPAYRSEAAIEGLKKEHPELTDEILQRAEKVLRGEVRYERGREFSTEENAPQPIAQYGDVANYSDYTLHFMYASSDLLTTGLYGVTGGQFTVYVDADEGAALPHIAMTEHKGHYTSYRTDVTLYRGANTFTFSEGTGPLYLVNPYTPETQRGDVSLYIEGGDFYPVFAKDGDKTAFLGDLAAYRERMRTDSSVPDLAELETDHALFTTTCTSLYDTYIQYQTIDPQTNLELWGELFNKLFAFNGIAADAPENEGVRLNFRNMRTISGTGAYATRGLIGFYNEHYWFANYNNSKTPVGNNRTDDYSVFAMGHEIGHVLDTDGRTLAETTNNMSAAYTFLKVMGFSPNSKWNPYADSFDRLVRDGTDTKSAYSDIHIMYTGPQKYDKNYMVWWYLESCFENYWANLNQLYRTDTSDGRYLPANERMVYYSSLVTGTDLGGYFERWGMYLSGSPFTVSGASKNYQTLMQQAREGKKIETRFDRYYYADDAEYAFIRTHEPHEYSGDRPTLSVRSADGKHTLSVAGRQDPAQLGYEIRVQEGESYRVVGFTRSARFIDEEVYQEEPVYTVVGVNRFFALGEESEPVQAGAQEDTAKVCRVGDTYYASLLDGMQNVPQNGTVYLLSDCTVDAKGCYKDLTLQVDDSVTGDIHINNGGNTFLFQICANVTLRGTERAHIVIDGGSIPRMYPPIIASSATFTAEYVDFTGGASSMGGGAIMAMGDTILSHCTFENCTGKLAAFISVSKSLTLEDCTFADAENGVSLASGSTLILKGGIPQLSLTLADNCTVKAEGFTPDAEELSRLTADGMKSYLREDEICFGDAVYTLTFRVNGETYTYTATGPFLFPDFPTSSFAHSERSEESPQTKSEGVGPLYISAYQDVATCKIYHAGDVILPQGDMTFDCTTAEKVTVTLLYRSGEKAFSLRPEDRIYLPRTDGQDKISQWRTYGGTVYPAGGSAPATEEVLIPLYEGSFRYDFSIGGTITGGGYAVYGEEITLPQAENVIAWSVNGVICTEGPLTLTHDALIIALYEGDLPPVEPEEPEEPDPEEPDPEEPDPEEPEPEKPDPEEPVEPDPEEPEPEKPDPEEPESQEPEKPVEPEPDPEEPEEPEEPDPEEPEEPDPEEPEEPDPEEPEEPEEPEPEEPDPEEPDPEDPEPEKPDPEEPVEPDPEEPEPEKPDPEEPESQEPEKPVEPEPEEPETQTGEQSGRGCNGTLEFSPLFLLPLLLPLFLLLRKKQD